MRVQYKEPEFESWASDKISDNLSFIRTQTGVIDGNGGSQGFYENISEDFTNQGSCSGACQFPNPTGWCFDEFSFQVNTIGENASQEANITIEVTTANNVSLCIEDPDTQFAFPGHDMLDCIDGSGNVTSTFLPPKTGTYKFFIVNNDCANPGNYDVKITSQTTDISNLQLNNESVKGIVLGCL